MSRKQFSLAKRSTFSQRLMSNVSLLANGTASVVVPVNGAKSILVILKSTGQSHFSVYPNDLNNNFVSGSQYMSSVNALQSQGVVSELGGADNITIYVFDTSALANTITLLDVFYAYE